MKFLIKFATRSRPAAFIAAMNNIRNTYGPSKAPDERVHIMVTADQDDPSMRTDEIVDLVSSFGEEASIHYGISESKVHAINRDMDMVPHGFQDWNVLINMSDDMQFVVYNWGQVMRELIRSVWPYSTDFFAHFNDGRVGDALATMSIIGRSYYERDGYIYHPDYKSFSCDAEAWFVARYRNRHHYFPNILFLHNHPEFGKSGYDELYRINSQATPHDLRVYWTRLNGNFGLGDDIGPTPWDQWKGKQPNNL